MPGLVLFGMLQLRYRKLRKLIEGVGLLLNHLTLAESRLYHRR